MMVSRGRAMRAGIVVAIILICLTIQCVLEVFNND